MKLEYIKKENIANMDILDNITPNAIAILLHVDENKVDWWIEINHDFSLYVPDGCIGFKTTSIFEAVNQLQRMINKDFL